MSVQQLRIRLTGERPLLMHSSRLADPLEPIKIDIDRLTKKRDKTIADHEQIAKMEWYGGLWLQDDKPCIPCEAVESAFTEAAKTRRKGKQAKAGFSCAASPLLQYDGPSDLPSLWEDKTFRFRFPVNVNDSKVMRTRPRFSDWHVVVDVEFLPSLLNPNEVIEILEIAGLREGLGDWRPKFGKFSVAQLE
ncbi:hypothetical protein [Bradyrhizobium sp. Ash2021]|uniref:hypothetical protein n=1 Tax=Bradyrhizobium sp. Ash2021 TaxID=2954771 RepID=UPI0028151B07|nr:hypothetical protein [Bradyrhizobium sp. Ash2021]WMT73344.1 hypothetical protein NL528_36110 [Bradyrhizobium sp. Ash2021]